MNENESRNDQENAGPVAAQVEAREPNQNAGEAKHPRATNRKVRDRGFTRTMEALVAAATVVSAAVAFYQWQAMKHSNIEARKGADAAVAAVKESQRQFNLQRLDATQAAKEERERAAAEQLASEKRATASLEESRRLNRLTEEQVTLAKTQAQIVLSQIAKDFLKEQHAAELAREAFMGEYQARINAMGVEAEIGADNVVNVQVRFKNVGKVTAVDARFAGAIATGGPNFDSATWPGWYGNQIKATLAPNEEMVFKLHPATLRLDEMERVMKDELTRQGTEDERSLYVFGLVNPWFDPFKRRPQILYFCYQLVVVTERTWRTCPNNNVLEYLKTLEEMKASGTRVTVPYANDSWFEAIMEKARPSSP